MDITELFRKQLDTKYNDHNVDTVLKNFREYLDELEDSTKTSIFVQEQIDPLVILFWLKHIREFLDDIKTADLVRMIDLVR